MSDWGETPPAPRGLPSGFQPEHAGDRPAELGGGEEGPPVLQCGERVRAGTEAALASASRDSLLALARFADEATDGSLAGPHPPKLASVPPTAKGDGRPSLAPRGTVPRMRHGRSTPALAALLVSAPLLAACSSSGSGDAGGSPGGAGTGGSTAMTTTLHPMAAPPCPARPRATVPRRPPTSPSRTSITSPPARPSPTPPTPRAAATTGPSGPPSADTTPVPREDVRPRPGARRHRLRLQLLRRDCPDVVAALGAVFDGMAESPCRSIPGNPPALASSSRPIPSLATPIAAAAWVATYTAHLHRRPLAAAPSPTPTTARVASRSAPTGRTWRRCRSARTGAERVAPQPGPSSPPSPASLASPPPSLPASPPARGAAGLPRSRAAPPSRPCPRWWCPRPSRRGARGTCSRPTTTPTTSTRRGAGRRKRGTRSPRPTPGSTSRCRSAELGHHHRAGDGEVAPVLQPGGRLAVARRCCRGAWRRRCCDPPPGTRDHAEVVRVVEAADDHEVLGAGGAHRVVELLHAGDQVALGHAPGEPDRARRRLGSL